MKKLVFDFQISEPAFELLLSIAKEGYAEYRDSEFPTLESWGSSERNEKFTDKYFLSRNTPRRLYP